MKYIVMTSAAHMPNSCWGKYGNVAVIETNGIDYPKQIHPNHKAVLRIVYFRGKLNIGKTDRCAFYSALNEAKKLAEKLNAK